ncbi:hypothetical protein [Sphingomonas sp.]|uniref:hypothetical protein n=1 Tax=Sphingomonas sp. TaxID=28214 RepID=UPI002E344F84|nr:hypothetical protein [Sphingomonas sp.]HEX4695590.1 hypothetical protein [Sphingomonas sp.]
MPAFIAASVIASLPLETAAQTAKVPARTGTQINLSFRPPLSRVLRYRIRVTKYREGVPITPKPVTWVEELRYEETSSGYTLYWRMDPMGLAPEMRAPQLAMVIKPFTGDPIAFDVDAAGIVVRVRDWPQALASLHATVEASRTLLLAQPGATPALVDKVSASVGAQFDALTAETAPSVILKNIDPILGWGAGMSMRVGDVREGDSEVPVPLYGTSVKAHAKVALVAADDQSATIVDEESVDPASIAQLMARVVQSVGSDKRPSLANINMASSVTVTVDKPTGLVSHFRSETREGVKGPLVQQIEISWQR